MSDQERKSVSVSFTKSNFFRTINVDGAWGGISPNGQLHAALYSERLAIPSKTELDVDQNGLRVGVERIVDRSADVVREIEADLIMDISVAAGLYVWLEEKLADMQKHLGMPQQEFENLLSSVRSTGKQQ